MTLTQMECFVAVAETGSMSKAGAKLYISQQTVSRQVKAIESELEMPLFERKNTGVNLTRQGQILYQSWKEIVTQYRTSVDQAKDAYYKEKSQISIGLHDMGAIEETLKRGIELYNERYPDLDVEYEVLPSQVLYSLLEQGKMHMVIGLEAEIEKFQNVKKYKLFNHELQVGLYMSARHPLALKKEVRLEDLQGYEIGVFDSFASLDDRERVTYVLEKKGIIDKVQIREYRSRQNLLLGLITGKCVTIAFHNMFAGREDKLKFYPLYDKIFPKYGLMVAVAQEKYEIKAENLIEILESMME